MSLVSPSEGNIGQGVIGHSPPEGNIGHIPPEGNIGHSPPEGNIGHSVIGHWMRYHYQTYVCQRPITVHYTVHQPVYYEVVSIGSFTT